MGASGSSLPLLWDWSLVEVAETEDDPLAIAFRDLLRALNSRGALGTAEELRRLREALTQEAVARHGSFYSALDTLLCLMGAAEYELDMGREEEAHAGLLVSQEALGVLQKCVELHAPFLEILSSHAHAPFDLVLLGCRSHTPEETSRQCMDLLRCFPKEAVAEALRKQHRAEAFGADHGFNERSADFRAELGGERTLPSTPFTHEEMMEAEVDRLTRACCCAWQCMPSRTWPAPLKRIGKEQQVRNHRRCQEIGARTRVCGAEQRRVLNREMMQIVLGVQPSFIEFMLTHAVFDQSRAFSVAAHAQDKELSEREEFQAGRNVWAAFALQLILLNQKADCNSAILGYSMLYPYTDNWLDLPSVSMDEKKQFQKNFRRWLAGQPCSPEQRPNSPLQDKIFQQVANVEARWPREQHPNVFWGLVAINDAQTRSLAQHMEPEEANYADTLYATVYKGGTSVLADLFVGAGNQPSRRHRAYAFFLGVGLQIVDDLQDVKEDSADKQQTLFTVPWQVTNGEFKVDSTLRRLCNFLASVLRPEEGNNEASVEGKEGMRSMCFGMTFKALARTPYLFSQECIDDTELYCPIPMGAMKKLKGMKSLLKLVKNEAI